MAPNFRRWAKGLLGAIVSGGVAGSGSIAFLAYKDPKDWADLRHALSVFGIMFALSGMASLIKYLQQHPVWNGDERRPDGVTNGNTDTTDSH